MATSDGFDFGEEGRLSHDFSYFSIPFLPWVFGRRLFKVLRKKNEMHCSRRRLGAVRSKSERHFFLPRQQPLIDDACSRSQSRDRDHAVAGSAVQFAPLAGKRALLCSNVAIGSAWPLLFADDRRSVSGCQSWTAVLPERQ